MKETSLSLLESEIKKMSLECKRSQKLMFKILVWLRNDVFAPLEVSFVLDTTKRCAKKISLSCKMLKLKNKSLKYEKVKK